MRQRKQQVGRPKRKRCIRYSPDVTCFKPAGIPNRDLDQIDLTPDELEAMRLAHLEHLYQAQAAKIMHVSRQTFGRIIQLAHYKVADALVHGKSIVMTNSEIAAAPDRHFQCRHCDAVWNESFGTGPPIACPDCNSTHFQRISNNPKSEKEK